MNTSEHPILSLLRDAERKRDAALDRAERAKIDADKHAAEAEAYRRALQAVGYDGAGDPHTRLVAARKRKEKKGSRPPSKKWVDIYTMLYLSAEAPYDYPAIMSAASGAGHEITDGAMRTQMMNAVNAGLFERVDAGKFEFSDAGLALIDAVPDRNEASADASDANAEEADSLFGVQDPNSSPFG